MTVYVISSSSTAFKTAFTIDNLNKLKTKTKCHALQNGSQSTANSG